MKNRVDAINKVHTLINDIVPDLRAALTEGFKQKDNGELFLKDRNRLKAIIKAHPINQDATVRVFIRDDKHSIYLKVDARYDNESGSGNFYYNVDAFLWSHMNDDQNHTGHTRPILTVENVLAAKLEAQQIEKEMRALLSKHQDLVHSNRLLNTSLYIGRD